MSKLNFPSEFLWGTSSAAHQVEGNNNKNDWWIWEKNNEDQEESGTACNEFRDYKKHIDLMKKMGLSAYRLSIEWSRIYPKQGQVNLNAVKHYKKVLIYLNKKNIKVFLTLHHFTNPIWFSKIGGFEKRSNIKNFTDFVELCAKEYQENVDYWITINEPSTYVLKSYLLGIWPPGNRNILSSFKVYRNLALSHNLAYLKIKDVIPNSKVGAAHQIVVYTSPVRVINKILKKIQEFVVNEYFYNKTKNFHDFYGINYYFKNPVSLKYLFKKIDKKIMELIIRDKGKDFGWTMDPSGISEAINLVKKLNPNKEIFILEHGISDPTDKIRSIYIKRAVKYLHKSILEGAQVRGYMHWSLLDNFEWNLGYTSKFGLCKKEKNGNIKIKSSGHVYKKLINKFSNINA